MPITRTFYVPPLPEGAVNIQLTGEPLLQPDKKGNNYYSVPFRAQGDTAQTLRQKLLFTDRDMDLMIQALQAIAPTNKLTFKDIVKSALKKPFTIWQHKVVGETGTFYNWYYSEEAYKKALEVKTTAVTTDEELADILGE
jgi:hypothetical protein